MKRRDLIRRIDKQGCTLIRTGKRHDWYQNPKTGMCQPIPRRTALPQPKARTTKYTKNTKKDWFYPCQSVFFRVFSDRPGLSYQ